MSKFINTKSPNYSLSPDGEFKIDNYNFAKPLANFFPGIAGRFGIPMWVFYVNRGQAIASLGTKDKNHAILEFFPANKAWQLVSLQGFRTFIKLLSGKKTVFYEPFHNGFANLGFNLTNSMSITSYDLKLEERNSSLGLRTKVEYFTIPNDSYAGLVRIVTIQNLSRASKDIQLLDGLPQIVPFGTNNLFLKKLGRTIEAWMQVENLQKGVAFYKLDVDPTDRPEVTHIKEGNFYLAFHYEKGRAKIIKPIVDPQPVFGPITDFSCPVNFLSARDFRYPKKEITESKTPSALLLLSLKLRPLQEETFYSVVGYMRSCQILNSSIPKIVAPDYLDYKKQENKFIIDKLQSDIDTFSGSRKFDLYAKQTYLDNIIRGGYPIVFKALEKKWNDESRSPIFYLFSRKHGDLERDYNKFQIQPTYFSQGNGNYRDMNQNRRCDVWFNPDVKEENIITFFNLIQTDGFNPLVVKGDSFLLKEETHSKTLLKGKAEEKDIPQISSFLGKPFTPGQLILFIEEHKIKLKITYDDFLDIVISNSIKIQDAQHGEGFWTDHWHYNLDLLKNHLGIYPEKLQEIVLEKKVFTYFDNAEIVKPRSEKYVLYNGLPRQLQSVACDATKKDMIRKRTTQPHVVRSQHGSQGIYRTTLINKLLCLFVNKMSSLDPFGIGIEMEANKPNWYDALNGLPALFGSSLCETFELKRLILFIKAALGQSDVKKLDITEEIHNFLMGLGKLIQEYLASDSSDKDFQYWDKSYSLKEDYRYKTRLGFSGKEITLQTLNLIDILDKALNKINLGIRKAQHEDKNVYFSYFINEVAQYEPIKDHFIKPLKFVQKRLPLFLEGQVHAIRLSDDLAEAKALYAGTKNSQLFDKKLKMYKVTACLKGMPEEIGRCRVFTPGWLENESIWLHMEYKYLLEILKAGLYEEFYEDFKNVLIPFQNPKRYGRSILENSSFITSSAFPDKNLHGNGFVARLSGSTAEFLEIWLIMNLGKQPFFLNQRNELNLRFSPLLPGWIFTRKNKTYSFNFLGRVRVMYHNPKRKNTFGKNAVKVKEILFQDKDGNPVKILSDTIPSPYALQIRSRQINKIELHLG